MKAHTAGMDGLISQLRDDLGHRRIARGIETLERARDVLVALRPGQPQAGIVVGLTVQWVDAGFDSPRLVAAIVERFPRAARTTLPVLEYLHLRMADGLLAMSDEDFERAAAHFRCVQSFENEIDDAELLAIANFWTGRCLRKMGRYDDAFNYVARGEQAALACGYTEMAAIMQTARSWLAFQKGKLNEATALLRRAEEALCRTDDYLSRGNIQSAYGRIARRQGRYERAYEHFERAKAEYRDGSGARLQLARSLMNQAFVERLLALEVERELERGAGARGPARQQIEQLRTSAYEHLDESMAIYAGYDSHHGVAGVHLTRGFLHLDSGDLEAAAAEAAEAYQQGQSRRDAIAMARARTLRCMVENAAIEEQVGDAAAHHEAAETSAQEAVAYAAETQNRRLLARAYVWQGLTFANSDFAAAQRACEQAIALLQPDAAERQYVWEDLEQLKAKVLRAKPVDATLRAWSTGITEDASFQQMTEQFARIVIPKVWEREGRKVSRVAEKLSISPKKVRRILHSAGLLPAGRDSA